MRYAVQGKNGNLYTRAYTPFGGNWVGAGSNIFGQVCQHPHAHKVTTWKTRAKAEEYAAKLGGTVVELAPNDQELRAVIERNWAAVGVLLNESGVGRGILARAGESA